MTAAVLLTLGCGLAYIGPTEKPVLAATVPTQGAATVDGTTIASAPAAGVPTSAPLGREVTRLDELLHQDLPGWVRDPDLDHALDLAGAAAIDEELAAEVMEVLTSLGYRDGWIRYFHHSGEGGDVLAEIVLEFPSARAAKQHADIMVNSTALNPGARVSQVAGATAITYSFDDEFGTVSGTEVFAPVGRRTIWLLQVTFDGRTPVPGLEHLASELIEGAR